MTPPAAGLETEEQHVNRQVAEMELRQQAAIRNQQRRFPLELSTKCNYRLAFQFQYVQQQRWECLYNAEEHH